MATDTLFLRVDSTLKEWLEEYVRQSKRDGHLVTQSIVVERILSYYRNLSRQEQNDILEGTDNRLAGMGRLVYGLGWGDHAFNKHRWAWALEEYNRLEDIATDSSDFQGLLRHKQGYCCLDIAIALRREALLPLFAKRMSKGRKNMASPPTHSALWDRTYMAADTAISMALAFHQDSRVCNPVVTFNTACGWALRGKYAVERQLGPESKLIRELQGIVASPSSGDPKAEENCWEKIGKVWRDEIEVRSTLPKEIQRYTQEALNALQKLDSPRKDSSPPTDTAFLVRLAGDDPDLMFLRCDAEAQKKFDSWYEKADSEERMLKSFEAIVGGMAEQFRERLRAI